MKVLGIDPGTGRVGWSIVEGNRAKQKLLACGCFETLANSKQSKRLLLIANKLEAVIEEFQPDVAAIEDLFFFKNAKTVIRVGEGRGVAVVTCERKGLEVFDYTPLQVKLAISGYGKADKKQVQEMVKTILKLDAVPKPDDAADAVAVAVTHLFSWMETRI